MSDQLPEGFVIQSPAAATPSNRAGRGNVPTTPQSSRGGAIPAAPEASSLPPGFEVLANAPNSVSSKAYAIDQAKSGTVDLLSLAGAPVSLANAALGFVDQGINKLTGATGRHLSSDKPVGGIDQVGKGWEGLMGVKNLPQPVNSYGEKSKGDEYIGSVARFVGGGLFPGASVVAQASRKIATAMVLAAGDTLAGLNTIAFPKWGASIAESLGFDPEIGKKVGETLAPFSGVGVTAWGSQKLLKQANSALAELDKADIRGLSKESQEVATQRLLMKDMAKSLEHAPHSKANLARSLEISKKVPEWQPTGPQASDAPGLIATAKEVASKSPEALARAAAADERNRQAIAAFTERSFPKAQAAEAEAKAVPKVTDAGEVVAPPEGAKPSPRPGAPADPLLDPARVKLSTNRMVMQMEADKQTEELARLTQDYRRTADNEVVGQALRDKYWQARAVAKQVQDTNLADVYATAKRVGVVEDMTDVRDAVKKIISSDRQTFQNLPPLFQKVLQEYPEATAARVTREQTLPTGATRPIFRTTTEPANPGKSDASFEEVHSLYKQANKDWADATAAGDSTKAFWMKQVKDQLQSKIAKYDDPQTWGALGQKFSDFNQGYTKYAHTFKEGLGGEIAKRTRSGITTDAEDIVSKLILQSGDKKKGVQDFLQVYGGDAQAAKLLSDGITDSFSRTAVRNGSFDPKAAAGWLKKHETAMAELPSLREKLSSAQRLGNDLVNRRLELQKQRQVLDSTVLAKIAGSDDGVAVVNQALKNPKFMKGLMVGAITPESKAAVARAIVDVVLQHPDNLKFILANERSLKPVMEQIGGKAHWENLKTLGEMQEIASRVKAPTAVELGKIQDIGEQLIGTSAKGLLSRVMNMNRPLGLHPSYVLTDVGGRWFYKANSEELARLREVAMFDPKMTELLATMSKQQGRPTHRQLLDLQRLGFASGVNGMVGEMGRRRERD